MSDSYHDDLFPTAISYGAQGGPQFSTTVLELASGYEKRNINWSKVRAQYNVGFGIKTPEHMELIQNFFMARWGRAYSFPYLDWRDYKIENQSIGSGDGITKVFQVFKRYSSGGYFYDREITKLKPNSISGLTVNGVTMVEKTNPSQNNEYKVDNTTGKITFFQAPASAAPINLGAAEFYVHCRFDTDLMNVQLVTYDAEGWTNIVLVEIKEDNS